MTHQQVMTWGRLHHWTPIHLGGYKWVEYGYAAYLELAQPEHAERLKLTIARIEHHEELAKACEERKQSRMLRLVQR